jgi:hypothetical protein
VLLFCHHFAITLPSFCHHLPPLATTHLPVLAGNGGDPDICHHLPSRFGKIVANGGEWFEGKEFLSHNLRVTLRIFRNQSTNQSINPSIHQSINQSINLSPLILFAIC